MPDGAGTHEATGELVIALPRGGSVTVRVNLYLVIVHPSIRCAMCVDALWVGLWNTSSHNPKPNARRHGLSRLIQHLSTVLRHVSVGSSLVKHKQFPILNPNQNPNTLILTFALR